MSIHVALHHRTSYRYDRPISLAPHTIRLRPAPHCRTPIEAYSLKIQPDTHFINWQQDPHGNFQARVVFPEKTRSLEIVVDVVADMAVINPFDFFLEPSAEKCPFRYDPILDEALAPFRKRDEPGPLLAEWLAGVDRSPQPTNDFLVELNQRLQKDIGYIVRMEFGVQTPEETLSLRTGSCRDTGWLLVQILRHLGFAARFVSGYLIQLVADEKPIEGPAGPEIDFTDLHAWTEVYLPGAGWVGLDPTSGLLAAEGHIPLACTPEPPSAAPVTGAHDAAEVEFGFEMEVERIRETPRVTKPYDDNQWQRILALGERVDGDLKKGDVRLTMGGEPTFVSVDDMDGEEWNFTALAPTKRRRAGQLLRRLADRFAPNGLLHYGQGKWYPDEPLPRWALSCYWRKDGEPVWRDRGLLADPEIDGRGNADSEDAHEFLTRLATRIGVKPSLIIAAYEDHWYYLWREQRLPVNVDTRRSRLDDELERERLSRLFDGDLGAPVGFILPLRYDDDASAGTWRSAPWYFRHGMLFLHPGDSPVGLRLPLDRLPWVKSEDFPHQYEADPMAPREDLPSRDSVYSAYPAHDDSASHVLRPGDGPPQPGKPAKEMVRTALCAELREGYLHIFMPPFDRADAYLGLIAAVEDTAAEVGCKVVIEGYVPEYDPRLESFSVTPDPGVIEVNIHPAASWGELVERTEAVYEDARITRLGTEKFMLDGKHSGTGGGNHFVIGGTRPEDSPLLRRPHLLRSLLTYWNNHPALSYLFSGTFIGPTSQHPRVDEARHEALYELEIAFQRVDGCQGDIAKGSGKASDDNVPPWLVDRLFRNLLVDVTGNTHRAEFCIDKLYSPDSASGRRGLLELRAFEMPPHSRMSLAQQLLLRALVAAFWNHPYTVPLVRWGTRLHDEFMLPHFVWRDILDVISDLQAFGYAFEPEWFATHQEFRFPEIGAISHRGIEVELRQALEPWPVLGEQAGAGGTSRGVDSSVERLQVRINGQSDGRYVVACNGHALPLRSTGTEGEFIAGLRYRAWQPPSALHPTIPVHAPLVFDVFDTWSDRSIGGCTYHVAHPGGRSYDTFPVNANEAEARRRARFFKIGHTPGTGRPRPATVHPQYPLTLDLRYADSGNS